MLQQSQTNQAKEPSAADTLVTPAALSAALIALEANRQNETEKIRIGEALTELNLDFTPEEIYAEIKRQTDASPTKTLPAESRPVTQIVEKKERWQEAKTTPQQKQSEKIGLIYAAFIVAFAFLMLVSFEISAEQGQQQSRRTIAEFQKVAEDNRRAFVPDPTYPLAQIKNGETAYADSIDIERIAAGDFAEQLEVSKIDSSTNLGLWRITKHSGRVYLRAYTGKHPPQHEYRVIYSRKAAAPPGTALKLITLFLPGLHWGYAAGRSSDDGQAFVSKTRLDRHAYEKW